MSSSEEVLKEFFPRIEFGKSNTLHLRVTKSGIQLPVRLLRVVFEYIDIYHLSKCFGTCKTFLRVAAEVIRNNRENHVYFRHKLDGLEKSIRYYAGRNPKFYGIFFPMPFLYCLCHSGLENSTKTSRVALNLFSRILHSVKRTYEDDEGEDEDDEEDEEEEMEKIQHCLEYDGVDFQNMIGCLLSFQREHNLKKISKMPSPWGIKNDHLISYFNQPMDQREFQGNKHTAIYFSLFHGNLELCKEFCESFPTTFIRKYWRDTMLLCAVCSGLYESVKFVLDETVTYRYDYSFSDCVVLLIAARFGYTDIFELLLKQKGMKPEIRKNEIFITSAKHNHLAITKILMGCKQVNPNDQDNRGFLECCKGGHTETLKFLLSDPRIDPKCENFKGLLLAMEHNRTETVELLLPYFTEKEVKDVEFVVSVIKGDMSKVKKMLLEESTLVDPSTFDQLAIFKASEFNHYEILCLLLEDSRVDPSACHDRSLRVACKKHHVKIIRRLLEDKRVRVISFGRCGGRDNLHDALGELCNSDLGENMEIFNMLMADTRTDPYDSWTSLENSIKRGYSTYAVRLINGERIKLTKECFRNAVMYDRRYIFKLLREQCKMRCLKAYSSTFSYLVCGACTFNSVEILNTLMESLDDPVIKKEVKLNKYVALDRAVEAGFLECIKLLKPNESVVLDRKYFSLRLAKETRQFDVLEYFYGLKGVQEKKGIREFVELAYLCEYCTGEEDLERIKELMKHEHVNPGDKSQLCLRQATTKNLVEVVKVLLCDKSVRTDVSDDWCVKVAAQGGRTEIVRLYVDRPETNVQSEDHFALTMGISHGYFEVVKILVEKYAKAKIWVEKECVLDVFRSCVRGGYENVREFVTNHELFRSKNKHHYDQYRLEVACETGDVEVVKDVLEKQEGVDTEEFSPRNNENYSLAAACENGHVEIVKLLLEDGRVDPTDDDNICVKDASHHGYSEILKLLLENDIKEVDVTVDSFDCLSDAIQFNHVECVSLLLKTGKFKVDEDADLNLKDEFYSDYFIGAAKRNETEMVKLLLQTEIDPSFRNNKALGYAIKQRNQEIIELLLSHEEVKKKLIDNYRTNFEFEIACSTACFDKAKEIHKSGKVNPHAHDNRAFLKLVKHKHYEMIIWILENDEYASAEIEDNLLIRSGINDNHVGLVKCLLSLSSERLMGESHTGFVSLNDGVCDAFIDSGGEISIDMMKILLADIRIDSDTLSYGLDGTLKKSTLEVTKFLLNALKDRYFFGTSLGSFMRCVCESNAPETDQIEVFELVMKHFQHNIQNWMYLDGIAGALAGDNSTIARRLLQCDDSSERINFDSPAAKEILLESVKNDRHEFVRVLTEDGRFNFNYAILREVGWNYQRSSCPLIYCVDKVEIRKMILDSVQPPLEGLEHCFNIKDLSSKEEKLFFQYCKDLMKKDPVQSRSIILKHKDSYLIMKNEREMAEIQCFANRDYLERIELLMLEDSKERASYIQENVEELFVETQFKRFEIRLRGLVVLVPSRMFL